jgi:RNA polymerase primary sigma factor
VDKIARIRRITNVLTAALGREPTPEELADEVGVPVKNIRDLLTSSQIPVSLNIPVNEGEATELSEIIADS